MEELVLRFLGINMLSPVIRDMERDLARLKGEALGMGGTFGSAVSGITSSATSMARIVGGATAAMGGGIVYAAKQVADLDFALNLLQTHAGFTGNIDKLREGIIALSDETGVSATQIAQADYFLSSQGGLLASDYKTNLDAATAAVKTSVMTHSDLNDTFKSLGLILQDFPEYYGNSAAAAGALNAIIGGGVLTVDEFNQAVKSGFLGTSKAFHQSFLEVGTFMDLLTRESGGPSQAATILRNMQIQIEGITDTSAKRFAAVGMDQAKVAAEMRGPDGLYVALGDILDHLQKVSVTDATAFLANVFGRTKGGGGAQQLANSFAEFTTQLGNNQAAAGRFEAFWTQTVGLTTVQFNRLKESARNFLIEGVRPIMPAITLLIEHVTTLLQQMTTWANDHKDLITKMVPLIFQIGVLTTGVLALVAAFGHVAMFLSPLRLLFLGIAAAVGLTAGQNGKLGSGFQRISDMSKNLGDTLGSLVSWFQDHIMPSLKQFADWFSGAPAQAIRGAVDDIARGWSAMSQSLQSSANDVTGTHVTLLSVLRRFADWFTTYAIPRIGRFIEMVESQVIPALVSHMIPAIMRLIPVMERFARWFLNDGLNALVQFSTFMVGTVIPGVVTMIAAMMQIGGVITSFVSPILSFFDPFIDAIKWLVANIPILQGIIIALLAAFAVGKVLSFVDALTAIFSPTSTIGRGARALQLDRAIRKIGDAAVWSTGQIAGLINKLLDLVRFPTNWRLPIPGGGGVPTPIPEPVPVETAPRYPVGEGVGRQEFPGTTPVPTGPVGISPDAEAIIAAIQEQTIALCECIAGAAIANKVPVPGIPVPGIPRLPAPSTPEPLRLPGRVGPPDVIDLPPIGTNAAGIPSYGLPGAAGAETAAGGLEGAVGGMAAGGEAAAEAAGSVGVLGGALEALGGVAATLGGVIASPFVVAGVAIAGLTFAVVDLVTHFDDVKRGWQRVVGDAGGLKDAFNRNVGQPIADQIASWSNDFRGFFVNAIPRFVEHSSQAIADQIASWAGDFNHFFHSLGAEIQNLPGNFISALAQITQMQLDQIASWGGDLRTFFESIPGWLDQFVNFMGDGFGRGGQAIADQIASWSNDMLGFFTNAIPRWSASAASWIGSGFARGGQAIADQVASWSGDMRGFFQNFLPRTSSSTGGTVGHGFAQAGQAIADQIASWSNDMRGFFQEGIPRWSNEAAHWLGDGFVRGGQAIADQIASWSRDLENFFTHDIPRWSQQGWEAAKGWVKDYGQTLADQIASWAGDLHHFFSWVGDRIQIGRTAAAGNNPPSRPPKAGGGYFTSATDITVGEAGPEWVLNLHQMKSLLATPVYVPPVAASAPQGGVQVDPETWADIQASLRTIAANSGQQLALQQTERPTANTAGFEGKVFDVYSAALSARRRGIRGEYI